MVSKPHRRRLTAMFSFRYPAVIILSGLAVGIIIGRQINPGLPFLSVLVLAGLVLLVWVHVRQPQRYYILPLGIFVLAAGWFSAATIYQSFPGDDVGRLAGAKEKIRVFGEIVKWPVIKKQKTIITCRVDSILRDQKIEPASGQILLTVRRETTRFAWGDKVSFTGMMFKPRGSGFPGQFDYGRYLTDRGIRGTMYLSNPAEVMAGSSKTNFFGKGISTIRGWIIRVFHDYLTEDPAALASGFLIGETHDIPEATYQAFRRTGTMHLLAVSGSNVALVLVVVLFVLRLIPIHRFLKTVLLLVIIIVFSNLSYNQPSVIRAALMAALALLAGIFYRRIDFNNIIPAAAAIILFFDPTQLFDIGFELSFAVTWGLALFLPPINAFCEGKKLNRPLRYVLLLISSSLVATLISAPITTYYFGEASLVSAVSNLIIVPLVSAAVIGIMILLLAALILPPAAMPVGYGLNHLLDIITRLVEWFSRPAGAAVTVSNFHGAVVFIFLVALTLLFFAIGNKLFRRSLVFFLLIVSSGYLLVDGLSAGGEAPSLEIMNNSRSQTIIVNAGGGVVLFRQRGGGQADDFSQEVIPYLLKRHQPFPQQFVFFEPQYRTEQRLEMAAAAVPSGSFLPTATADSGIAPSVYYYRKDSTWKGVDYSRSLYVARDWAVVKPAEGMGIAYIGIEDLPALGGPISADSLGYLVVPINDDKGLVTALSLNLRCRLIFLPEKPLSDFKVLSDSNINNILENLMDEDIVESGEYAKMQLNQ